MPKRPPVSRPFWLAACAGLAGLILAETAPAMAPPPSLARLGWQIYTIDSAPPARFESLDGRTIDVSSDGGFALLYRPVTAADGAAERLCWRWRVDAAPPPADLATKGGDDRPLAVHVWFPDADPGPFGWLRETVGPALLGVPVPGRAITYVWGGRDGADVVMANPHLADGRLKVLQHGETPTGEWRTETVDVRADYAAMFGEPAPRPAWIAISVDTDDLGGASRAAVADLGFVDG